MSKDAAKKRCLLTMPTYGGTVAGDGRSFWKASTGERFRVGCLSFGGSLLAHVFNHLWCAALNEPPDYFAMIHADIEAAPGWLDELVEELEARELDVLGVAVPIKDPRGLTSIALAREDGDNWEPHCRLSMREIFELPETFTSEDVGGRQLLLNTGLWVCRFDMRWAPLVHFEINDRIVIDPDGRYVPQVESEDWYFSRLLNELGLKLGCTRKIPVEHHGKITFSSDHAWGTESFDETLLDGSALDKAPASVA